MKPDIKRQSVNQLLNSLEPGAFERVAKKLTRVKLRPKEIVYKPNEPIDHVIFPENAVVCLMTIMSNGETIEAATVGREGASWISASVGAAGEPLPGELQARWYRTVRTGGGSGGETDADTQWVETEVTRLQLIR